jgi:trimethylamine--corrinoid protein Co-methyltransferase
VFAAALSPDEISRLHEASLAVLQRTGIVVPHPEILQRFADSGAQVDFPNQRVRISAEIVEDAISTAGNQFTIYGRDIARTAQFGFGRRNYNTISGEAHWVDAPGGERRFARLKDVSVAARFADALPEITVVGAMTDPADVPVSTRCIKVLAELLRNTTKPVGLWYHDRRSARYLNEIVIALRGDAERAASHPVCYPFLEPISPLRFPFDGVDLLFETSLLNLPVPIGPMAQMGLSAPPTIAGTLVQENAEILAGICITQLIKPGLPVCYGGICHAFDMGTTQLIFGGPEQAIFGVAMTQMGKHYGLPVYINVGLTDSKRPDGQAGIECGTTLMLGAAAGADIFGHMGISGVDQASSLDILLLQCEAIAFVESAMREISFDEVSLGLEEIAEVGPGGTFVDRDFTAAVFRKELWFPRLLDRRYYEAWRESGAQSMESRIAERKQQILDTARPVPIDAECDREITRIVSAAERDIATS